MTTPNRFEAGVSATLDAEASVLAAIARSASSEGAAWSAVRSRLDVLLAEFERMERERGAA